jgi:hypothetical protein
LGDLKKFRLFISSCIFYVPAVILEETICRNIWFGVNIFPTKFHEDILYQLLAHGRWFPLCTPASFTTKTGCHDIAEMLLKVASSTTNQSINQSNTIQLFRNFNSLKYVIF